MTPTGVQSWLLTRRWQVACRLLHAHRRRGDEVLRIHRAGRTGETGRLGRRVPDREDLAVHGLEGDIRHGGNLNSYYDNPHDATGRFDFIRANGSMSSACGIN